MITRSGLIVPPFEDTTVGDPCDFRDPKVFVEDDKYYMVTASTHKKDEGVLLLHVSEDGEIINIDGLVIDS